jgi:hypothetical protein
MAPILAMAEAAIAAAIFWFATKYLFVHGAGIVAWIATVLAAIFGLVAGWWLAFEFSYELAPEVIVSSAPVPVNFLVLEKHADGTQQWTNFPVPEPAIVAIANFVFVLTVPIGVVLSLHYICSRLICQHKTPHLQ